MSQQTSPPSMKSKIDMNHGFMKSIIRNQHDRDNYEREVQSRTNNNHNMKNKYRSKKPDVAVYQPPKHRSVNYPNEENRVADANHVDRQNILFKVEYEDENGRSHNFNVRKGADLEALSYSFGSKINLAPDLIEALHVRLKEVYSTFK